MRTIYDSYETLQEEFQHLIVLGVNGLSKVNIPILEKYISDPSPETEYGVVSQIASENLGAPSTVQTITTHQTIQTNIQQQQLLVFSVELLGMTSRDIATRLRLWLRSQPGNDAAHNKGMTILDVSGIRALHELITGGKVWERRSQFDVDIAVTIEQPKNDRPEFNLVESVCVTTKFNDLKTDLIID